MGGFDVNAAQWRDSELSRKAQKTVQNHVGEFHQKVLGAVVDWEDLGTGENVDLRNTKRRIIAEVKNKHNTVKGDSKYHVYDDLDDLISLKASRYYNYSAYFVTIIPLKSKKNSVYPFVPSVKGTGKRRPKNDNINVIDGHSFYELVTGRPNALAELYAVLPTVIENVLIKIGAAHTFTAADNATLNDYFAKAFKS